jgi:DNA-directed RNA polymerase subunit M/transcription elongation factor TFIIS
MSFPFQSGVNYDSLSHQCPQCGSDKVQLSEIDRYVSNDDSNPCQAYCMACGKTWTIWT